MNFLRRRHEYRKRAEAAEQEVAASRRRLEETRKNVVEPLAEARRRNQFAEIIRAGLINGYNQQHQRKA